MLGKVPQQQSSPVCAEAMLDAGAGAVASKACEEAQLSGAKRKRDGLDGEYAHAQHGEYDAQIEPQTWQVGEAFEAHWYETAHSNATAPSGGSAEIAAGLEVEQRAGGEGMLPLVPAGHAMVSEQLESTGGGATDPQHGVHFHGAASPFGSVPHQPRPLEQLSAETEYERRERELKAAVRSRDLLPKRTQSLIAPPEKESTKSVDIRHIGGIRPRGTFRETDVSTSSGLGYKGPQEEDIQQVLDDMHDFRREEQPCFCDWVVQVTAMNETQRLAGERVQTAPDHRLYRCRPDEVVKVKVKNLSLERELSFVPVYVDDKGDEEPEDEVTLTSGEVCEEIWERCGRKEAGTRQLDQ